MSTNSVIHFEMPYEDKERVSGFYEKAFGWNMMGLGEEMGNYVMAQSAPVDENQIVTKAGVINGGFAPKSETFQKPSVVIGVDDIHLAIENIKNAGGKIITEIMEIPGIGLYADFLDSEGNKVSILQP